MRKKKVAICFAQVPFFRGGAELHVASLRDQFLQRGYDAEIFSIPYRWYPRIELLKNVFAWRLLDLNESNHERIDLAIGTKFPSYLARHENKVIWLIHQFRQVYDLLGTDYSDYNINCHEDQSIIGQIRQVDKVAFKEARRIFTNSNNTANRLKKYNKIEGTPLYHPPSLVGQYRFKEIGDYILAVGRLDNIKRVDLLLKSLLHTSKEVKSIVVGTGSAETDLKELVHNYDLYDKVTFTGYVPDQELIDLYANCLAVYYAPYDEDYGYITLEAFLSSKPVITTSDAGGVLEFVRDQVNGIICEPNPQDIGTAIERLFTKKSLVKEYGANGYSSVKDISWDYVIESLTETLR